MAESKQYDVVIIGAGPGGMTAAMYASRANLSVLMLDRGIYGGNLNNTAEIENYTGFKSVKGPELAQQMYEGATQFGAEYAYGHSLSGKPGRKLRAGIAEEAVGSGAPGSAHRGQL